MANNKKILIHNKFYKFDQKINKDYCHNNNDVQSSDRLYSIIDQILSFNVKVKSSFLNFWFSYWFYNDDFQKNKFLSKKIINKPRLLGNIIFAICIIALFFCIILGIAIPIIQSTFDTFKLLSGKFAGKLLSNGKIIGFAISEDNISTIVNSAKSILLNAKVNPFILDNPSNLWIKFYLEKYYMPFNNITDMSIAIDSLLDYIAMNFQYKIFVIFRQPFQVLSYFYLVNSSLSNHNANELALIFGSFSNFVFTALNYNNIFSDLKATNICLTSDYASQALLVPVIWKSWFSDATVIIPLCFTLIFVAFVWFHIHTIKVNKKKYTSMSMYNYVSNKINFSKKLLSLNKKLVFLDKNIIYLKHNFILNFQTLDKTSTYNTLRLLNYMYSVINSTSIVLVANYSEELYTLYSTIIEDETNNLSLTIVDEDYNGIEKNNEFGISDKVSDEQMIYLQYRNYLYYYISTINSVNEIKELTNYFKNISPIKNKLTFEQEDKLANEILTKDKNILDNKLLNKTDLSVRTFNKNVKDIINKIFNSKNDEAARSN